MSLLDFLFVLLSGTDGYLQSLLKCYSLVSLDIQPKYFLLVLTQLFWRVIKADIRHSQRQCALALSSHSMKHCLCCVHILCLSCYPHAPSSTQTTDTGLCYYTRMWFWSLSPPNSLTLNTRCPQPACSKSTSSFYKGLLNQLWHGDTRNLALQCFGMWGHVQAEHHHGHSVPNTGDICFARYS